MNKINPTVFIICGVFNNLEYTKKLLKCIEKQNYSKIKTIIIDDGSSDNTSEYIEKNYPEVIILKGDGNLWWTGAMHLAVEEVMKITKSGDYILTMNNDCTFDQNYVDTLVRASNSQNRAIVGSLIINNKKRSDILDTGIKINWEAGKFITLGPSTIKQLPKNKLYQEDTDLLPTKGTIFPIEVFKKIGNFDKKHLPHYLSDYEFTHRAKKNNFKLILSYQARVFNDINRTGFGDKFKNRIDLRESLVILFSRRSRLNIIDSYRFINLCCPPRYRIRNYLILVKKIVVSFFKYQKYLVFS